MKIFRSITLYSRMIKLSHSLFALPFAGIGWIQAVVSSNYNSEQIFQSLLLIIICMVSARSAAMGMNRLADRYFDLINPRTKNREIPSGQLSPYAVGIFITISSVIFIVSSYALNILSFYLSFLALFVLFLYSFSKRFTWLCHFILGISIGFAPLGAWIGVSGEFNLLPLLWFGGLLLQIAGFDILYSIQDMEVDIKSKLFSIPSRLGLKFSYPIVILSFIFSLVLFIFAGIYSNFSPIYYILLLLISGIMIYEYKTARAYEGQLLPPLFYQLNSFISIFIFLGVAIEYRSLWSTLT